MEISVVECGTRRKAQQFEQSPILSLLGYKHQAVKQSPEVILINYTISVLVHETESGQSILQTIKRYSFLMKFIALHVYIYVHILYVCALQLFYFIL